MNNIIVLSMKTSTADFFGTDLSSSCELVGKELNPLHVNFDVAIKNLSRPHLYTDVSSSSLL